jgi:hypothetical protein
MGWLLLVSLTLQGGAKAWPSAKGGVIQLHIVLLLEVEFLKVMEGTEGLKSHSTDCQSASISINMIVQDQRSFSALCIYIGYKSRKSKQAGLVRNPLLQ